MESKAPLCLVSLTPFWTFDPTNNINTKNIILTYDHLMHDERSLSWLALKVSRLFSFVLLVRYTWTEREGGTN